MYSVLRLEINGECPRYRPFDTDSKLNDLLIEGSYLPWQIQKTEPHRNHNTRIDIVLDHVFHEAGHGLVKVYDEREADLYDTAGQLKFLSQFDIPDNGWGKNAGMREARVHAFSILIQEAIDPEFILTHSLREMTNLMPGHCQGIADNKYDKEAEAPFAEEVERILSEFTPADVLTMWKELCARLHTHHQTIDMEEMAATIDNKVRDALLGWTE